MTQALNKTELTVLVTKILTSNDRTVVLGKTKGIIDYVPEKALTQTVVSIISSIEPEDKMRSRVLKSISSILKNHIDVEAYKTFGDTFRLVKANDKGMLSIEASFAPKKKPVKVD